MPKSKNPSPRTSKKPGKRSSNPKPEPNEKAAKSSKSNRSEKSKKQNSDIRIVTRDEVGESFSNELNSLRPNEKLKRIDTPERPPIQPGSDTEEIQTAEDITDKMSRTFRQKFNIPLKEMIMASKNGISKIKPKRFSVRKPFTSLIPNVSKKPKAVQREYFSSESDSDEENDVDYEKYLQTSRVFSHSTSRQSAGQTNHPSYSSDLQWLVDDLVNLDR